MIRIWIKYPNQQIVETVQDCAGPRRALNTGASWGSWRRVPFHHIKIHPTTAHKIRAVYFALNNIHSTTRHDTTQGNMTSHCMTYDMTYDKMYDMTHDMTYDMTYDMNMTARYNAIPCNAMHCCIASCLALQHMKLHYFALHVRTLHYMALRWIALHCNTVHYVCIHLRCITCHRRVHTYHSFRCIPLRSITYCIA